MRFEGCVEAREISFTRKAARQGSVVLALKSAGAAGVTSPQPGNEDMATAEEIQKAATPIALAMVQKTAAWTDVVRTHFAGLPADKTEAFMAKSVADQTAEAEAAKAEAARVATEKEAAAAGKTAVQVELERTLKETRDELATMRAERETEKALSGYAQRASEEFAGYPGGVAEVVKKLASISKLPEADRIGFEDMMKSQAALARQTSLQHGGRTESDLSKAATAQAAIEKKVSEVMVEKKWEKGRAFEYVTELPEFAEHVALIG